MGNQGLTVTGIGAIERFAAMGTRVELHAFGDAGDAGAVFAAARRAVEAVDDALTIHRPSPVTALNEALMAGGSATIDDPLLFEALVLVDDAHAGTLGLFDIAADERRGGSWAQVSFDREARRIAATCPLALDFGGVGKGIALDRAAAVLRPAGVRSALLNAGESSILCIGEHPLRGGWPFAIPHPLGGGDPLVEIELRDEALSISASIGTGTEAPERAATIRPGHGRAVMVPRLTAAIAASAAAAEMMSTALLAAHGASAHRLLHEAPKARLRFDLEANSPVSSRMYA